MASNRGIAYVGPGKVEVRKASTFRNWWVRAAGDAITA